MPRLESLHSIGIRGTKISGPVPSRGVNTKRFPLISFTKHRLPLQNPFLGIKDRISMTHALRFNKRRCGGNPDGSSWIKKAVSIFRGFKANKGIVRWLSWFSSRYNQVTLMCSRCHSFTHCLDEAIISLTFTSGFATGIKDGTFKFAVSVPSLVPSLTMSTLGGSSGTGESLQVLSVTSCLSLLLFLSSLLRKEMMLLQLF